MTLKTPATCLTALVMMTSGAALAQSQPAQPQTARNQGRPAAESGSSAGLIITRQQSSEVLVSSLIGMPVKNGTGKQAREIGAIADVVLDRNHKVVGVLIGVGGFLGIGEKYVGVPWDAVQVGSGTAVVDVSRKQLQQASPYMSVADQKEKRKQQQMKQNMQQQQMPSINTTGQ